MIRDRYREPFCEEVVSARQSMLDSSLDTTDDNELDLSLETTVDGAEDEV